MQLLAANQLPKKWETCASQFHKALIFGFVFCNTAAREVCGFQSSALIQ